MKHITVVTFSDHTTRHHGDFATPMLASQWGAAYARWFNQHQVTGPTVTGTTVVPVYDPVVIAQAVQP